MTLEFEIKPIVLIDYLVTKLPDVDNEALAHQIELYKGEKFSHDEMMAITKIVIYLIANQ